MSDDISVIAYVDPEYPDLLREIHKPPQQLYIRGDKTILSSPYLLGVVGSRKATMYGRQACASLLPPCVRIGMYLVSGMAYGIDSFAHRICIDQNRPTIAVLGSGVDDASLYPRGNKTIAQEILANGGAIISEYEPGTKAMLGNFPARNRIIAGLCKATLIVQAAKRSGSLITARLAMEENRDVLAIPGPITDPACEGTNMLIRDGAGMVLEYTDIISRYELQESEMETLTHEPLREELAFILSKLSADPLHIEDIAALCNISIQDASAGIAEMEMIGVIEHVGGMKYVKK
ncbi:MAG: DNA protecting protein DprA [Candidatus Andersenbacteria bacterium RIFCSPHIGHO2_12_FULL_45_11b]|uniref:DNA protecting protein DprA n=1 Tax=Candidatus Andersenbacteria bacterium RIFCSPHIGHO2_12_FULL_45_11b TaxID=1797282 RepID=A0A1G1X5W8_9BACT|nr:MAG: DNA protecting protein DprA [Candidatus Andersenbacteria bacterium RIFCSPHIGHO2_12_FULL_45_11b]